ncbi:hypothetical protein PRUPE_8G251500 [Prunus persica]|uniref:Uncharacterized protein n=1 Tax=Prunus persica TaxID=3760 RepID=A0A251N359_PRUPE|nr:hypothetical protein PRUPE_8G251500 [Prunus persica]
MLVVIRAYYHHYDIGMRIKQSAIIISWSFWVCFMFKSNLVYFIQLDSSAVIRYPCLVLNTSRLINFLMCHHAWMLSTVSLLLHLFDLCSKQSFMMLQLDAASFQPFWLNDR